MSRSSTVRYVTVTAAGQFIGPSPERRALVFSPPATGEYSVSNAALTAIGQGLTITAGSPPIVLTQEIHGDCIQKAWFVITSATPMSIAYIEAIGT